MERKRARRRVGVKNGRKVVGKKTRRCDIRDRAGGLHKVDGRDGVDVGGREDGLAAVVTVVGLGGAGHVAAAAAGATAVAVVAR